VINGDTALGQQLLDLHAASWIEFTGREGTQPGLCFFDLGDDGRITRITDFWPDPNQLPPA
jgi:hypothetical protein